MRLQVNVQPDIHDRCRTIDAAHQADNVIPLRSSGLINTYLIYEDGRSRTEFLVETSRLEEGVQVVSNAQLFPIHQNCPGTLLSPFVRECTEMDVVLFIGYGMCCKRTRNEILIALTGMQLHQAELGNSLIEQVVLKFISGNLGFSLTWGV